MSYNELYYLGTGTEFVKAQCKEYKKLDGALKAAAKDESLVVWDENGNVIGSLTNNVLERAIEEDNTTDENAGDETTKKTDSVNAGEENLKEDEGANTSQEDESGEKEEHTASGNDDVENPQEQQETHTVEQVEGAVIVKVICEGTLNLRRSASFEAGNECGRASKGQSYYCKAIHTINGKKMIETIDGLFLSGEKEHIQISGLDRVE